MFQGWTSQVWCFQCAMGYAANVTECVECGVRTFPYQPTDPAEVGGSDDEQLAYECHDWTFEGRSDLEARLHEAGLSHAWIGATLIVRAADEATVDAIVHQSQRDRLPALDPQQDTITYELGEFSEEQRNAVVEDLVSSGVPHELNEQGDLVVAEADEAATDAAFERLRQPESDAPQFGPGLEGVEPYEVLEALFFAADRLRRNDSDAKAMRRFTEAHDQVVLLGLPWGFEATWWRSMLGACQQLRSVLDNLAGANVGGDDEPDVRELMTDAAGDDEPDVRELAAALRDLLHTRM